MEEWTSEGRKALLSLMASHVFHSSFLRFLRTSTPPHPHVQLRLVTFPSPKAYDTSTDAPVLRTNALATRSPALP